MSVPAALVALACYAAAPAPAVNADVMAALRGDPVINVRPDIAEFLARLAPVRRRRWAVELPPDRPLPDDLAAVLERALAALDAETDDARNR